MQEAEEDLQAVLPDLDRAEHGLRNLDKKHFDEIRCVNSIHCSYVRTMHNILWLTFLALKYSTIVVNYT